MGGGRFNTSSANANNSKSDDKDKRKCNECRTFACKRQDDGKCICKWNSKFDLANIEQKGRRDFVELMRGYRR